MKKIVILGFSLLMVPVIAFADIAPGPHRYPPINREIVWPITNEQIIMESEDVLLEKRNNSFYVECTFVLHNTGDDIKLLMGFPAFTNQKKTQPSAIKNFTVIIDDGKIPIELKDCKPDKAVSKVSFKKAYFWNTNFKKGERKTIKNTYKFSILHLTNGLKEIGYILTTGAFWQGNIGKAVINVKGIHPLSVSSIFPGGYKIEDKTILWDLKDFEPDSDVKIQYSEELSDWVYTTEDTLKKDLIADNEIQRLINELVKLIKNNNLEGIKKDFAELAHQLLNKSSKDFPKEKYLVSINTAKREVDEKK